MNLKSLQPVLPADHSSLKEGRTMIIINFLKMGEAAEKHYRKLLRDSLHELNAYRGGHVRMIQLKNLWTGMNVMPLGTNLK